MRALYRLTETITHCRLLYNSTDDTYSNNTGVEVRVPGFGDTSTVEFLDSPRASPYFSTFVDYFAARGYERGSTIRAAPYDWRLAGGKSTLGEETDKFLFCTEIPVSELLVVVCSFVFIL